MTNDNFVVGAFVKSLAGREIGETFIVVGTIDKDYVYIANGDNRTIKKPKKKKIKHLQFLNLIDDEISNKIKIKRLLDSDIRKSIKSFNNN